MKTTVPTPRKIERFHGEWSKDQAQRHDGTKVGHETRRQHGLAVLGGVETELDHHGVDHGDRSRRHRNAGKPARHHRPSEQIMSRRCAPQERKKKLASPTAAASFHFNLKTTGSSSAPARKVRTIAPMPERNFTQDFIGAQYSRPDGGANDQLGDCPDDNLRQSGGDAKPDREQARYQRQPQPQRRKRPNSGHLQISCPLLIRPRVTVARDARAPRRQLTAWYRGSSATLLPTPSAR